jgi:hypothetical protein
MEQITVTDRLTFLAKTFDVFECGKNNNSIDNKIEELKKLGYVLTFIDASGIGRIVHGQNDRHLDNPKIIAIISSNPDDLNKRISICSDVFSDIIAADPTENKMYVQWMLNLFTNLIKTDTEDSTESAIRFVNEDLPQANIYLKLFEGNKRKKKFMDLCKFSYSLKNVTDPSNINQYQSLSQLFDAVDPFIEKEPSSLERTILKYV